MRGGDWLRGLGGGLGWPGAVPSGALLRRGGPYKRKKSKLGALVASHSLCGPLEVKSPAPAAMQGPCLQGSHPADVWTGSRVIKWHTPSWRELRAGLAEPVTGMPPGPP